MTSSNFYFLLDVAKKKIIDKKCPICGKESNNIYGIRITVESQNCKTKESTTTSLFNDDVTNLFALDKDALASADDLLYKLSLKLPVSFTVKKIDNRFYNIDKM